MFLTGRQSDYDDDSDDDDDDGGGGFDGVWMGGGGIAHITNSVNIHLVRANPVFPHTLE